MERKKDDTARDQTVSRSVFGTPEGYVQYPKLDPEEVDRLVALGSPTDLLQSSVGGSAVGVTCGLDSEDS